MIPQIEWLYISLVVLAIVVLMVVAELWFIFGKPPAEYTRKLVHLGSGFISLSFAFLFESHWSVFVLCVLFVALMLFTKFFGFLKAVHAVQRKSYGALYFPLATYLTFLLAWLVGQPLYYFIAIAVLSTSDTIAALVGGRYGFSQYQVEEDKKSLEGSVMFFLSCYLIVHVTLLLGTDILRINSVLVALWVAIIATLFEAVSIRGADNFWVPLGTFYLLWKIASKTTDVILTDLAALAASVVISLLVLMPRRKLEPAPIAGISMILYSSARLLDWNWGIPVLTAMLLFNFGGVFRERHLERKFQVLTVLYSIGATLIWVIVSNLIPSRYEYIKALPFLITLGAMLSIGWGFIWNRVRPQTPLSAAALKHTGLRVFWMTLFLFMPQLFFYEQLREPMPIFLYMIGIFFADRLTAVWIFYRAQNKTPIERTRIAFLSTLVVTSLQFFVYAKLENIFV
jgi:phosphatidate cytidylyltransferase/phytol kinase